MKKALPFLNMNRKSSFEIRLAALFVAVILIVTITGLFAYQNLSGLLDSVMVNARPDLRLAQIRTLNNKINEAEVYAKAYTLTNHPARLNEFYTAAHEAEKSLVKLDELSPLAQQKEELSQITDLVDQKFSILNQFLLLQDANRAEEALEKVAEEVELKKSLLGRKEREPETEPSLLSRWFQRKKEKSKTTTTETLADDLKKRIDEIKQEEEKEEKQRSEQELQLTITSDSVDQQIATLTAQMEQDERKTIAATLALQQKQARDANRLIVIFCILAGLMLATMFILTFRHISNNKKYRRALKQAKERAEELSAAKERFVANMSHEIRTPLNAINGFLEQVLQTPLQPKQKEQLEIAQKSGDHLLQIVNEILDFSKLSARKFSFVKANFNPVEVAYDVKNTFTQQCQRKGLKLEVKVDEKVPEYVLGDAQRLKQILINLVGNSVKFTHLGSIHISVNAKLVGGDSITLEFAVADTGTGIPKDEIQAVITEFEQATHNTSNHDGTGLGLNITNMLIEQQGGAMHIESEVNQGTKVTFEIPYEVSSHKSMETEPEYQFDPLAVSHQTVLIADDNPYNRKLLTSIFEKWNVTFTEVDNGLRAVEEMQKHRYDLVLMDIRMPVMDGFDAARKITEEHDTTVIAVTAGISAENEKRCKESGMSGLLLKPFSEKKLFEIMSGNLSHDQEDHTKPEDVSAKLKEGKNKRAEYDLTDLMKMSHGNHLFAKEMIELFISTTREALEKITLHHNDQNWEMMAEYAHKMAGPCRHLEAMSLLRDVKQIETLGRQEKDLEQIPQLIEDAKAEANAIINQLEIKLEELHELLLD